MVLTYEQEEMLEILKTTNKLSVIEASAKATEAEHKQKMERLKVHLEIAQACGKDIEDGGT